MYLNYDLIFKLKTYKYLFRLKIIFDNANIYYNTYLQLLRKR